MKCERCGKGIGVTRRGQALSNGYICYKCLDELGFDKSKRSIKPWIYEYWEIKDGPDRIKYNQAARKGKQEDWLRDHPEFAAVVDFLKEDDEASPSEDDTNIDEDE